MEGEEVGTEKGAVEISEEEKEVLEIQKKKALALGSFVSKIVDFALEELVEYFSAIGLSRDEIFDFLEDNPDLLRFDTLDAAINEAIKGNKAIRAAISALIRAGGVFIKSNDNWREEFLEEGEMYILECLKKYRPETYHLLKDKERVVSFIKRYVEYKLGL